MRMPVTIALISMAGARRPRAGQAKCEPQRFRSPACHPDRIEDSLQDVEPAFRGASTC
jgi:hypothetical protein